MAPPSDRRAVQPGRTGRAAGLIHRDQRPCCRRLGTSTVAAMVVDRPPEWTTTFEPLSADECWEMIGVAALTSVGRVGFGAPEGQQILPVNFAVARRSIVVRTSESSMLHRLGTGVDVAFEVDHLQPAHRTGWSVLVHGRMWPVQQPDEVVADDLLHLHPWAAGDRDCWVRIVP